MEGFNILLRGRRFMLQPPTQAYKGRQSCFLHAQLTQSIWILLLDNITFNDFVGCNVYLFT